MGQCFRCEKSDKEVRLLDAIYENDVVKVCERCSIIEDIPVLRRPTTSQLREAERSQGVYQRLKRISGTGEKEEKHATILDEIRKLDENPDLEKPKEKKPFNLMDNFHWKITRARRNKGLSQRQLAWALGESETAIKMIEKGELPEEPEKFIRKLEQFFQIALRERTLDELKKQEESKPISYRIPRVDTEKVEREMEPIQPIISEPEIEEDDMLQPSSGEKAEISEEQKEKPSPSQILSFKPEIMKDITISDLQHIKNQQEKEEKLEQIEKELQKQEADKLIKEAADEEKRKKELKKRVAVEMKDVALGKEKSVAISEKKDMLGKAVSKLDKEEKKERVPTISELLAKKKKDSLVGDEIELEEPAESKEVEKRENKTEEQKEPDAQSVLEDLGEDRKEEIKYENTERDERL